MKISIHSLAWFVYLLTALFSNTRLTDYFSFLPYIKYIHLFLIMLLVFNAVARSKMSKKRIILSAGVLGLTVIEMMFVNDLSLLFYIVYILTAVNVNSETFWRRDIKVRTVFLIAVVCLTLVGVLTNYTMSRADGTMRYSMGFNHPNMFAGYCLVLALEVFCIKMERRVRARHYVCMLLFIMLIDMLTNSRTYEITILLVLILSIVVRIQRLENKFTNAILIGMPFILIAISFGLVTFYDSSSEIWKYLNELVSDRIWFAQNFMAEYALNAFGQDISLVGSVQALLSSSEAHILDMGYLRFILEHGVIFMVLLSFVMALCMKHAIEKKGYTTVLLLLFLQITALFESTFSQSVFNFVIPITVASMLVERRRTKLLKEE